MQRDFPDGPVVKDLPAKAGDGFNPWSGRFPVLLGATKPMAATTGLPCARPCSTTRESHGRPRTVTRREPHSAQLEKGRVGSGASAVIVNKQRMQGPDRKGLGLFRSLRIYAWARIQQGTWVKVGMRE